MRALITDEEAREAAREILSADAYTRWSSDYEAWLDLFDRLGELTPDFVFEALAALQAVLEKIGEWLQAFFDALGIQGSVAPLLGWLAAGAILFVLIALIAQWRLRRAAMQTASISAAGETDLHTEAVREAQGDARNGLFLEAAHRVQLASLAFLIEAGWVELARSDANPTLRQRVEASALPEPERVQLISLVDRLERRWFGASVSASDFASASDSVPVPVPVPVPALDNRVEAEAESALSSEGEETAEFTDRALYEDWIALDARLSRLGFRSAAA